MTCGSDYSYFRIFFYYRSTFSKEIEVKDDRLEIYMTTKRSYVNVKPCSFPF